MKPSGLLIAITLTFAAISCGEIVPDTEYPEKCGSLISFTGNMIEAGVYSKATDEVKTLSQFNVLCVTGETGISEKTVFNASFSGTTKYTGGQFWPNTDLKYKFYASNAAITAKPAGPVLAATAAVNTKDVVAAVCTEPVYKSVNSLEFKHIFAQVGLCKVLSPKDYTVTGLSVSIVPKVSGVYSLLAGKDKSDGSGWSSTKTGEAVVIASATGSETSNGLYLVPGDYELTVAYTLSRGAYTQQFNKTAKVSLMGGKINDLTVNLPAGNAIDLEFAITISEWTSNPITIDELI